jgi:beta-glucosidase
MYYYRAIFIGIGLFFQSDARELQWNWNQLDSTDVFFPKNFLWGCADSAFQTEGIVTAGNQQIDNSWTEFEKERNHIQGVGQSCQRWTRYKEDIALLHESGMNAYRFSIDWSKIEPKEGVFNQKALQHYIDELELLYSYGITPMLTLFHHVCPVWFAQKGGFEYSKNIPYFVRFARYLFTHLHTKVPFWIIFNEPVAYAMEGYFRGTYPPGKKSLRLAGKVIKHMLYAHVQTANVFRAINPNVKIGIAHMIQPLDSYSSWNLVEKSIGKWMSYLLNGTTIDFFKTGTFNWTPTWVHGYRKDAPASLDFIGINYYTHTTIRQYSTFHLGASIRPDDKVVDSSKDPERSKVMYPEGLYRAIVRASALKIPIFITENGCASANNALKNEYLKKHLYVVSRALKEGYPISGYFYWTLTDCYSWNKGFSNKHGIYQVNFETQERSLRANCSYLLETIKKFRKKN